MSAVTVRISYRGKAYAVDVPSDASVSHLGAVLERTTKCFGVDANPGTEKGDQRPRGDARSRQRDDASLLVADIEGLCDTPQPRHAHGNTSDCHRRAGRRRGVDHRVARIEEECAARAPATKKDTWAVSPLPRGAAQETPDVGPGAVPSTSEHPYTFTEYRALPVPAAIRPPASAALQRILHRSSRATPAILGVAQTQNARPLLAEMPRARRWA